MTASDFVAAVARSAPSAQELMAAGMSDNEARRFRTTFTARKLSVLRPVPEGIGEFADFFAAYDPGGLTIGMVVFASTPECRRDVVTIGEVEADPLVLVRRTGELQVIEHGKEHHVLWRCSRSPGALFDALAAASASLCKRITVEASQDEAEQDVSRCAELAGGQPYSDFYRMLIGLD